MPRSTADDPRYRRVRAQLTTALLDLAAQRPAETIGVSELTAAAGVSRAAFYAHSTSPAALLADVLSEELRPILTEAAAALEAPGADHVEVWRHLYLALLEHAAGHADVYRIVTARASTVAQLLGVHFEEAAVAYVRAVVEHVDEPPTRLWIDMAVSQQAFSMLSLVRAWLAAEPGITPEQVVRTYLSLAPPWQLARPDERGVISMRRSRTHPR